jgi:hypothetical protein
MGGRLPGHVEGVLEVFRGSAMKKNKEECLHGLYLDGEKVPWPKGGGQRKGGRGRVQVVFVWLSTKGLRQISPSHHMMAQKKIGKNPKELGNITE